MCLLRLNNSVLSSTFFRQFSKSSQVLSSVTIIGSGLMGSGIAQVSAQAKLGVVLVDQNEAILNKSVNSIEESLKRVARKKFMEDSRAQSVFVKDVMERISTSTDTKKAVEKADLVIEAVAENLPLKQKLLPEIEQACQSSTIIATNTSSLRLQDIAKNLNRKDRFGGLHFFNPVPVMKLLEIVRSNDTSDETVNALMEFGKKVGKITVACKDTPGFIVNRLLVPYMFEALRMAERGDASMQDIDTAMKLGAGYPMGPFELMDYVGLDTTKFIQDGWHSAYPDEPLFKPSATLNKHVEDGLFGKKSGKGFYDYS